MFAVILAACRIIASVSCVFAGDTASLGPRTPRFSAKLQRIPCDFRADAMLAALNAIDRAPGGRSFAPTRIPGYPSTPAWVPWQFLGQNYMPAQIRNFASSPIDHSKSTLADRMLQLTAWSTGIYGPSTPRSDGHRAGTQHHHQGPSVRLPWRVDKTDPVLHLIDTRAMSTSHTKSRVRWRLAGAVLLVDAAQRHRKARALANFTWRWTIRIIQCS